MRKKLKFSMFVGKRLNLKINQKAILITSDYGKVAYPWLEKISYNPLSRRLILKEKKVRKKNWFGLSKILLGKSVLGSQLGYRCTLNVIGIGYSFKIEGSSLIMRLGYSHLVKIDLPKDLVVSLINPRKFLIEGVAEEKVFNFGKMIQKLSFPNAYKEKGVFLENEEKRKLKVGKRS